LKVKALKGFKDILPDEVGSWQFIEATARSIFHRFGFAEIKVPILEKTSLFARSIGETTDIVEKEMYTFEDRNGDLITMRPEGTASVLRAFIEHSLHTKQPVQKLFTIGPMFRHERPQKGRLRQFHQMSVEVLGADQPLLDAEVMAMAWTLLDDVGLPISLEINSLGCPACRPDFNNALVSFLEERSEGICEDCERRRHKNPLRVLDCKNDNCRELYKDSPSILDHLCRECDEHFKSVEQGLIMLNIPYRVNSFMVRGLDYYSRTTFELITDELGAQSAVGAGGRYDGLVKQLGGPSLPGIGFAIGMERLVLLLQQHAETPPLPKNDIFIAALGSAAQEKAFVLAHALRKKGLTAALDYAARSLKSQMKQADKLLSRYTLIIGDEELQRREGTLRNMETKEQQSVALGSDVEKLSTQLAEKLGI
jgi:histidyl-tRNA synthetase